MNHEKHYDTAKLIGYNQFDDIVYSVRLSLYEYYDGEHVWDSSDGILKLRMVKMVGKLYDPYGKIYQEFESEYCPERFLASIRWKFRNTENGLNNWLHRGNCGASGLP